MHFNRLIPELTVANLTRSLAFYVEHLGFVVEFSRPEDGFAQVALEGAQLMLEQAQPGGWLTAPLDYPSGRGVNFQIEVSSLPVMQTRVESRAIPYFRPPKETWYRIDQHEEGVVEFLIQDPTATSCGFSNTSANDRHLMGPL